MVGHIREWHYAQSANGSMLEVLFEHGRACVRAVLHACAQVSVSLSRSALAPESESILLPC
eukprot:7450716-Alexandrium_andersonii.AAC.1